MNFANFRKMLDNIYIYIIGCTESCAICQFLVHFHFQEEEAMRIIIDTTKNRIIVPKSFFTELSKMNDILKEGGSTKQWTPAEYVKEQFEKAIKKDILRPDDKVK